MLRCWGLEKRIIRIRIIRMLINNVYPIAPQIHILYIGRLLINSLGAERWREASVELSDALIHITVPLLVILSPLDFLLFLSPFCPNSGFWMLVDIKPGSCVVEQSFFENIRRFESHHSAIGFKSSDLLSWECWTASSDLGTYKTILLKVAFVVDSRLRCCVVEKSFFRNIRRFEPHHSALAEVFGFLVFMFNVLVKRDGGGRRQK